MIPSEIRIKFDNLLAEAKYIAHVGDLDKAGLLLAEAQVLLANERRLRDVQGVPV